MFRKILLAYDGSEGAKRALEVAIDLAATYKSELWAISVDELPYYVASTPMAPGMVFQAGLQSDYYAKELAKAAAAAKSKGVELKTKILVGHAARAIVEFAEENSFDLIMAGHVGRSGIWGALLGSTSDRISHQSCCTVMIVK